MDRSNSGRKKRGISLSSTPNKEILTPRGLQVSEFPGNKMIESNVIPIQTKIVSYRPEVSIRNIDKQIVRFSYSSAQQRNEAQEGMMLDKQIHDLKKELSDKKAMITNLQNEIYRQKMYTPSMIAPISSERFEPRKQNKILETSHKINRIQEQVQSKSSLIQASTKNIPQKIIQDNLLNQQTILKKQAQIEIKKNKQNEQKVTNQRFEQLKIAEAKLLDIIRVCEQGL